jgi:SET domain-containing protein
LRRKRVRIADQVRVGRSVSGFGLFATGPFAKGEFIAEYWGRRIPNHEADKLNTKYMFELNSRWTIDGANRRNLARYINHSCRPNAEVDIVRGKIIIRAKRAIQPGEEITYNYGRNYFRAFIEPAGCRCIKCAPARHARLARRRAKARAAAR